MKRSARMDSESVHTDFRPDIDASSDKSNQYVGHCRAKLCV